MRKVSRGLYFRETSHNFRIPNVSFNAICENIIFAKISESTVLYRTMDYSTYGSENINFNVTEVNFVIILLNA